MDPDYCAERIVDATDLGERLEALAELEDWISGGGFRPRRRAWKRYAMGDDDGPCARTLADALDGHDLASVPTVDALAHDLRLARDDWRGYSESREVDPETGERYALDVRLQIHEGWTLRTGDSSYDQDHRGHWGASSVSRADTLATLRETARELISQVLEAFWTCDEVPEDLSGVDIMGLLS